MKIAFIGQKGIPNVVGGVETHVEHLSVQLVKRGHEVIVYTRAHYVDPNYTEYRGVQLVNARHIFTKNLDAISHAFFACIDVWRRKDVDVVHFQSIGPSLMIPLMRLLRPKIGIVATVHSQCYHHGKWGWFARKFLHVGEWIACNLADQAIVASEVLHEYLHMRHRCEATYVPNGVPSARYRQLDKIAQNWNLISRGYLFTMARLVAVKRIEDLIAAYQKLDTHQKLVIAYDDGNLRNPYADKILALAKQNSNIVLIPKKQQNQEIIEELFSHATTFVLPSSVEGFSITLLEAMSYGHGVVISDIPENTNVVQETGFVFKVGNVDNLAQVLDYVLHNSDIVAKKGAQAKKLVRKLYDWDMIAGQTAEVYHRAVLRKSFKKSHDVA